MTQNPFSPYSPQMLKLIERLTLINDPKILLSIEDTMGDSLYGTRITLSLPKYEISEYYPVTFPTPFNNKYIIPYLCYPYIYFIYHEKIHPYGIKIDYTLAFDTNFASYVKKIVLENSLKSLDIDIRFAFDHILRNDMNFDTIFYFVENIKIAYPIVLKAKNKGIKSPIHFWKLLDEGFRWNIVCLELFLGIDNVYYINTNNLRYDYSFIKAVRHAVDFTYNFYASEDGQILIEDTFLRIQRAILLQLLVIFKIQFSTKKNAKKKFEQFFEYLNESGEIYLEREAIMAYKYFKNRDSVPILNKINPSISKKGLLKRIDAIAWDIAASRFLERMSVAIGRSDYMVPFFFSFDDDLRNYLSLFPIKAVVYDRVSGMVHSIPTMVTKNYYYQEGCLEIVNKFFSPESQAFRASKRKLDNKSRLFRIKHEYKKLYNILKSE